MNYFKLTDFSLKNKRVIVRVGYDVPLKNGKVLDNARIKESVKTITYLQKQNAKIILIAHAGRPGGKPSKKCSLEPVAEELSRILKKEVIFINNCIGPKVTRAIKHLKPKQIILLENLRFHKEERNNDKRFAKQLASHANYYINEAFSNAHRKHASVDAITNYLPSAAGFQFINELNELSKILKPKQPFICVLGGKKVKDKIKTVESLAKKARKLLIGGALASAFIKAQGHEIGNSIVDAVDKAENILKRYHNKIILPEDVVIKIGNGSKNVPTKNVPKNAVIMDIGTKTITTYKKEINMAKTIFWNGPMGVFEQISFAKGTKTIAKYIAKNSATTIVGGGDSGKAVHDLNLQDSFTYVTTGGGAALELLAGTKLPAIEALETSYYKFRL
jgi:phosphoglycerate kinase